MRLLDFPRRRRLWKGLMAPRWALEGGEGTRVHPGALLRPGPGSAVLHFSSASYAPYQGHWENLLRRHSVLPTPSHPLGGPTRPAGLWGGTAVLCWGGSGCTRVLGQKIAGCGCAGHLAPKVGWGEGGQNLGEQGGSAGKKLSL